MPVYAVRLSRIERTRTITSVHILSLGDGFQVVRIYALLVAAQMVDTRRPVSVGEEEGDTMGTYIAVLLAPEISVAEG